MKNQLVLSLVIFCSSTSFSQTNTTYGAAVGTGGSGTYNSAFGYASFNSTTTGLYNSIFGASAGVGLTSGGGNSFFGYGSGQANNSGIGNAFFGRATGFVNTNGGNNTFVGSYSGRFNTTGSNNSTSGYAALVYNSTGNNNSAVGFQALYNNSTGIGNTSIGYNALFANTTGSNNTALGFGADVSNAALNNATAIGNGAIVTSSNAIQLGNASVSQIFAGTSVNTTIVTGGLKITGGTIAAGKVLTSDANGVATWQPSGGGTGGSSQWTTSGTTINYLLGNVGIGTTNPAYKLDINGSINASTFLINGQPFAGGGSQWATNGTSINYIAGNVGIGTTTPSSFKLAVEGKIWAKEVQVALTNPGPDYVFEKSYDLRTLEEVKIYIELNKHLPEIPSAKEMEKNGVQLGEMNMLLLKKIEELTLYIIEQEKRIQKLENKK